MIRRLACYAAAFAAISYAPYLVPRHAATLPGLTVFWSFWCSTAIILCDAAGHALGGPSLLDEITRDRRGLLSFLALGAACGFYLDGAAQWLGRLWIYPYWTLPIYAFCFIPGFCAYWLLLAESYFLALRLIRRALPPPDSRPRLYAPAAGAAGTLLAAAGLLLAFHGASPFNLATPSRIHPPFAAFPLVSAGLWLVLEYAAARQRKPSLLAACRHRDWAPLLAVLAAGWLLGLFMETANAALHFWRYTNWPLQNLTLAGVPVVVLLLWPMQYIVFLGLYTVLHRGSVWD